MRAISRLGAATMVLPLLASPFAFAVAFQNGNAGKKPLSPELERLDRFVGPWKLTEFHFDSTGKVIAKVEGTEEIAWDSTRRSIKRTYTSQTEDRTFRSEGTLTWDAEAKAYRGEWKDNLSDRDAIVVSGQWNSNKETMVLTYTVRGDDGNATEFNVIERFVDDKTRIATTFEVTGRTVVKRTEVEYVRAVPCPAKIRFVPDFGG